MEQETASIIKYVLGIVGTSASPYYHKVPEDFNKSAIYFPVPEFHTRLSSFSCFVLSYMWPIKIFGETTEKAYFIANKIALEIAKNRFLIPEVDKSGKQTGAKFTVFEPSVSKADEGVYTLQIDWDSVRKYNDIEHIKMQKYYVEQYLKGGG